MTISAQLQQIREALAAWAARRKGAVEIGARISDLFGMFAEGAPDGLRVRILFSGETASEPQEAGRADRSFLIVMTTPRGLLAPGDDTRSTAGHTPPYDLVEELRQILRGLTFDVETTAGTPDFVSIGIFTLPDGRPVDAYQIEIKINVQLPAPEGGDHQE